jgi:hypothetical protein
VFAAMLEGWRAQQLARNPAFPGRHAGQPAAYRGMAAQLRDHGPPLRTARISALRQLVLQVPAPVIADALGFHHTTTTRQHINAGATWSQYAGHRDQDLGDGGPAGQPPGPDPLLRGRQPPGTLIPLNS